MRYHASSGRAAAAANLQLQLLAGRVRALCCCLRGLPLLLEHGPLRLKHLRVTARRSRTFRTPCKVVQCSTPQRAAKGCQASTRRAHTDLQARIQRRGVGRRLVALGGARLQLRAGV
jgi:hypothetical protein